MYKYIVSPRVTDDKTPMQYIVIFHGCKNSNFQMKYCDIFLIFAQNMSCVHVRTAFTERFLMSTHNQSLRRKIRKNAHPCKPQYYYVKVGCKVGINHTDVQ